MKSSPAGSPRGARSSSTSRTVTSSSCRACSRVGKHHGPLPCREPRNSAQSGIALPACDRVARPSRQGGRVAMSDKKPRHPRSRHGLTQVAVSFRATECRTTNRTRMARFLVAARPGRCSRTRPGHAPGCPDSAGERAARQSPPRNGAIPSPVPARLSIGDRRKVFRVFFEISLFGSLNGRQRLVKSQAQVESFENSIVPARGRHPLCCVLLQTLVAAEQDGSTPRSAAILSKAPS
jgi:hypothetical protein